MSTQTISPTTEFAALPNETARDQPALSLREIIALIEGRGEKTSELTTARGALEERLQRAVDAEERGTLNYYLLRIGLEENALFENQRVSRLYQAMLENFLTCQREYLDEYNASKSKIQRQILSEQIKAFYQIVSSYLKTLELIYERKGFVNGAELAKEHRMLFHRNYARFTGRHLVHLGHLFLEKSSRYGHSFLRWGATTLIFIFFFAFVYAGLDYFYTSAPSMLDRLPVGEKTNLFNYLYFSFVTFTTVGYGDIMPANNLEKLVAGLEAITGYVSLGIFIGSIQKKL